jgi:hypothetical protein
MFSTKLIQIFLAVLEHDLLNKIIVKPKIESDTLSHSFDFFLHKLLGQLINNHFDIKLVQFSDNSHFVVIIIKYFDLFLLIMSITS